MTKERLRSYRTLAQEKKQLEHQIEAIEAALYRPKIAKYKPSQGKASGGNTTEDLAAKHLELLDLYQDKLAGLAKEQLAIEQALDSLPSKERTLLRHKYLEGLTWEEVCVAMHYSWMQVHRIHSRALETLRAEDDTQ